MVFDFFGRSDVTDELSSGPAERAPLREALQRTPGPRCEVMARGAGLALGPYFSGSFRAVSTVPAALDRQFDPSINNANDETQTLGFAFWTPRIR